MLRVRGEPLCFSRRHDTRDWGNIHVCICICICTCICICIYNFDAPISPKGIASQPEHLHLNPGVHKSQATIESLGPPQYSSETFSAIRASRHRSKYSKASVRLEQTTQSHDRQNWRLDSIRPSILRTAFLSRGSKALERNTQPCPPSSHPSTRCSP